MADREPLPGIRPDGLQLEEDRRLQERLWTAERVAHVVFALLVAAGLAGALGAGGPLASGTREIEGGEVDHPRILRWETSEDIVVRLDDPAAPRLVLEGPVPETLRLDAVEPQPVRATASPEGLALDFEPGTRLAALRVVPARPGLVGLGIAIGDGSAARFTLLVLP
jgi:hypothetical protein